MTILKNHKLLAGVLVLTLGLAFAAGRYSRPAKVVERVTSAGWVDAHAVYSQRVTETVVTRIITVKERKTPKGGSSKTVQVVEKEARANVEKQQEQTNTTAQVWQQEKEVSYAAPRYGVQATWCGVRCLGAEGQLRVLGPIWLGAGVNYKSGSIEPRASIRIEF